LGRMQPSEVVRKSHELLVSSIWIVWRICTSFLLSLRSRCRRHRRTNQLVIDSPIDLYLRRQSMRDAFHPDLRLDREHCQKPNHQGTESRDVSKRKSQVGEIRRDRSTPFTTSFKKIQTTPQFV